MKAVMTREQALIRLMEEHQADVWHFLRFLGCEEALADDLTQDTFLYVYRKPIVEISRAATAAYLRRTARSLMIDRLRRQKREVTLDLNALEQAWADMTPEGHHEDRLALLQRCLDKLAARAREAIDLKYAQDRTEAEVAKCLDTTLDAAKALLKRARQQLRECVERQLTP
jgi:RNA polymerase sigma-70 factor, ECF subfamily